MKKFELPDELLFLKNRNAVQKSSTVLMTGKVCVITGATSGVGLEALRKIVKGGALAVMVCRSADKAAAVCKELEASASFPIETVIADFSRLEDVRNAAGTILKKHPRIDVLINCAGLHSTKRRYTPAGFELVFCVNHLSSFLFTKLLMERIKESAPARILQVNSEGHRFNGLDPNDLNWKKRFYTGLRSYGASKTAQLLTVWELNDQLKGSQVTINALHPGDVRTNIGNNNGWLYKAFLHHVIWYSLKDPVISGDAIYYLASAPEMSGSSGRFFNQTIEEKPAAHALDREMGKRILALTMEMTGLELYKPVQMNDPL